MARVRQSQNDVKGSLLGALNDVNLKQQGQAQDIYQQELSRDEQIRQFNAQQAAARAAAAQQNALMQGLYGGGAAANKTAKVANNVDIPAGLQDLYNAVFIQPNGSNWSDKALVSDYNQTRISAGYGNQRDAQKLQLYHAVRPDLFGSATPASALGNGSSLRY